MWDFIGKGSGHPAPPPRCFHAPPFWVSGCTPPPIAGDTSCGLRTHALPWGSASSPWGLYVFLFPHLQVPKAVTCLSTTSPRSLETRSWRRCSCLSAISSPPRCLWIGPPTRANVLVSPCCGRPFLPAAPWTTGPSPWGRGGMWSAMRQVWSERTTFGGFSEGPVVRTLSFHCWGPGFDPWLRKEDPTSCAAGSREKTKNHIYDQNKYLLSTYCVPST